MKSDIIDKNTLNKNHFLLIGLVLVLIFCVVAFMIFNNLKPEPKELSNKKEITLENNGNSIKVNAEVAVTVEEHQIGLMNRRSLGDNNGMIFVFSSASEQSFWMKNTLIPLDIIFFDENGNLLNVDNAIPCTVEDSKCPIYYSSGNSKYVLEMNAGWSKKNNLDQNTKLDLNSLN